MMAPIRSASVVIPVYRGEASLPQLIARLEPVLASNFDKFEIILVNDCSPDGSWNVIIDLQKTHPSIRGLSLMRNYGQHNALLAGVLDARNAVLITMDDDLQNPPEEIPKLLAALADGHDLVYGARRREQHGFVRNSASRLVKWMLRHALRVPAATSITSFRAFRSDLVAGFRDYSGPRVFLDALLCWSTHRVVSVQVDHEVRKVGESGYSLFKLVGHTLNMITSFSVIPLQMAVWLGFAVTVLGFLLFCFVLIAYFVGDGDVPGFTFLAAVLTLFSGTQLLVLGILGEYLARMHLRLMGQPSFVVQQRIGKTE